MSKFKTKKGASSPEISTASLPDIIFMLLFFFMVVTVMKDSSLKVQITVPQATELEKLERKSLVGHLYIGKPAPQYQEVYGTAPRLQLNDQIAKMEDIPLYLEAEKRIIPEYDKPKFVASIRADKEVTMGIITDVKTKLRKSGQLRVNYSATRRAEVW